MSSSAVSRVWWIVLLQAILFIILGILFVANPGASVIALVQFLAFYFIVSGIFSIVDSLMGTSNGSRVWGFIAGLIGIIVGVYMIGYPMIATGVSAIFWMSFIGISSIFYGVFQFINGFQTRSADGAHWAWGSILLGLFNILFGILVLFYPGIAAVSWVWVGGIFLIVGGIVLAVSSFRMKSITSSLA
ncbi:MAG: HdeD family acid-resistance protein [Pyrinomonadaceae bacterium]